MGAVYDALVELSPARDPELLDGYRAYESALAAVLTAEQMDNYVQYVRRSNSVRVFEEIAPDELSSLSPDESAMATAIMADENASMENRRVAALLNQRGQHDAAPDLGSSAGSETPVAGHTVAPEADA